MPVACDPACQPTWRKETQLFCMFQMAIGISDAAAIAQATQKPGRRSCSRADGVQSRNMPTHGSQTAIVYLARMPMPTTTPASGQPQRELRKIAACAQMSAQTQAQVYGASIVIRVAPTFNTGTVRATATVASASR